MRRFFLKRLLSRPLDLQAKITLVLVGVILPTFLIVTVAENKLTQPLLEEEIRQIAINSGRALAAEIVGGRLLSLSNPTPAVESRLQDLLYAQPNIVRADVYSRDPVTNVIRVVASNVEEDPATPPPAFLFEGVVSEYKVDDEDVGTWEVFVPIEQKGRDSKVPRKLLGSVHIVISMKLVSQIVSTLWKTTASAAALSVVVLTLVLSYFLRKTIANDRLLRQAESQNLRLTERLHETQRELMNTEKLAVMGQLTASFAHEIGTPLNAIGGHLQLMSEELSEPPPARLEIIHGQLSKIETIVKSFLQSTAKPTSQSQLVDLSRLADKTLEIVRPRSEAMGVLVKKDLNREIGPVRVVPIDLEQILLNLVNNSLDSLSAKLRAGGKGVLTLEVKTDRVQHQGRQWAVLSVYDTGEGIKKGDIRNVLKPFFTTKRPGEGTGLGLTICQDLARRYGGVLEIDSKEGVWTRVNLRIPYQSNS